mmetsp:Transcript_30682/g.49643  ORF Transcript_30682/g.49643 Transcript_30682/m.49643 type:complete len:137 (+) Transcript_30682:1222-1632(+)
MASALPLQIWLCFVAALRFLAVVFGLFYMHPIRVMFALKPDQVTDLHGRTFAVWTLVTCTLCILCAIYVYNPAIYLATYLSFIYALFHFVFEVFYFKTLTVGKAAITLVVAGVSIIWMSVGFGIYLKDESYKPKRL